MMEIEDEPMTPEQREWFDANRANKKEGYAAKGIHLIGSAKVAVIFGVETRTAKNWIRQGRFGVPTKIGIRYYVDEDFVNAFIEREHGA